MDWSRLTIGTVLGGYCGEGMVVAFDETTVTAIFRTTGGKRHVMTKQDVENCGVHVLWYMPARKPPVRNK